MAISPHAPRRQRRALYRADHAVQRRQLTVPLSRELRRRFHRRSLPIHKGDTVRVVSGSFEGQEERVARVDRRSRSVTLENVTVKTGEEKMRPLPVRPSHLLLIKLNLADPWRRRILRVTAEELTAEERGETPEPETEGEGSSETPEPKGEDSTAPAAEPVPADASSSTPEERVVEDDR